MALLDRLLSVAAQDVFQRLPYYRVERCSRFHPPIAERNVLPESARTVPRSWRLKIQGWVLANGTS